MYPLKKNAFISRYFYVLANTSVGLSADIIFEALALDSRLKELTCNGTHKITNAFLTETLITGCSINNGSGLSHLLSRSTSLETLEVGRDLFFKKNRIWDEAFLSSLSASQSITKLVINCKKATTEIVLLVILFTKQTT